MLPVVVEPHIQKGSHDCGIAALATFCGLPYATVSAKALELVPTVHTSGLWATHIAHIAKALHVKLVRKKHPDPRDTDDSGIVVMRKADGTSHVATLFQGVLIDPSSGLIYDLGTYLTTKKYSIRAFLTCPLPKSK